MLADKMYALLMVALLQQGLPSDGTGSVQTGETDAYNAPAYLICPLTLYDWTITIKMVAYHPGDQVLVTASTFTHLPPEHSVAILDANNPGFEVTMLAPPYCAPFVTVTGLIVEDQVAYEISIV